MPDVVLGPPVRELLSAAVHGAGDGQAGVERVLLTALETARLESRTALALSDEQLDSLTARLRAVA